MLFYKNTIIENTSDPQVAEVWSIYNMINIYINIPLTIKNTWHFVLFLWFCIKSGYINRACPWDDFISYLWLNYIYIFSAIFVYTFHTFLLYIQNFDFLYIQITWCFVYIIYRLFSLIYLSIILSTSTPKESIS